MGSIDCRWIYLLARPFAQRRRRYARPGRLGPYAGGINGHIAFTALDGRTTEGQYLRNIRDALSAQIGPSPTAAQQLLIQAAAVKALRCELLARVVFGEEEIKDNREYHLLAWSNGLRRDLLALGLLDRPNAPLPDLRRYLESRYGADAEAAE
jgi:hypothetical protein